MKIKKILTLVLSLIIVFSLAGCKKDDTTTTYTQPSLTSSEEVVYKTTYNGYDINVTKGEVLKMINYYGGIGILLQQVDEFLLKDYISQVDVTSNEYISRYNRLVYSSSNTAYINSISAEDKAKCLQEYEYTMYVMGFDTEAKKQEYIKFLAARDLYTKTWLKDQQSDTDSDYYISQEDLETYYNDSYYQNGKAIVVNFTSGNDYRAAIKSLGLVVYNSELRLYTGDKALSEVAQRELNSDNTRVLTSEESLSYAVKLYNLVYSSYKDEATTTNVYTSSDFDYNFKALSVSSSTIATKIFNLSKDEFTYYVSSDTVDYGTTYTFIYRLDGERTDYNDLNEEAKAAVLAEYYTTLVETTANVTAALVDLRLKNNITFYDRFFAYNYTKSYDTSYGTDHDSSTDDTAAEITGDKEKILTVDGLTITCDSFYDFVSERDINYYVFYAAIPHIEETLSSYSLLYGDNRDLFSNASLRYVSYYSGLRSTVDTNYDDTNTTDAYEYEEDYIYQTYGYKTFEDTVNYYYAANDLKTMTVYQLLFNVAEDGTVAINSEYLSKIQETLDKFYDNYYDVYGVELSIYTDYNGDYKVDDMNDVINNLESYGVKMYDNSNDLLTGDALKTAYTNALDSFYTLVKDTVKDKKSDSEALTAIKALIEDYDTTSITDTTSKYYLYKKLGFKLSYADISTTNSSSKTISVTYFSFYDTYTDEVNAALKSIYDKVIASGFSDPFAICDSLTYDKDGAHFFIGTEGDSDKPSYKFSIADDVADDDDTVYNTACENDQDKLTMTQLINALYIDFYTIIATDSDTAYDDYHISSFPDVYPSDLDFSTYTDYIDNYFYSDNFVNIFYSGVLKKEAGDSFDKYIEIYTYFLKNSD